MRCFAGVQCARSGDVGGGGVGGGGVGCCSICQDRSDEILLGKGDLFVKGRLESRTEFAEVDAQSSGARR